MSEARFSESPLAAVALCSPLPPRCSSYSDLEATPTPIAMSQANLNKKITATADEGKASRSGKGGKQKRIRPRDEEGEEKQPVAQSSAHVSPAVRIYRHALEAAFGMLELSDLSRVLAVSREWSAAVKSMAPIRGTLASKHMPNIKRVVLVRCPLMRHIATLDIMRAGHSWSPLSDTSLALLARRIPNLQSLRCNLSLTSSDPPVFPAKLESLYLEIPDDFDKKRIRYSARVIHRVLKALAALPSLTRLHLSLQVFEDENNVDLSHLAACPSLTDLTVGHGREAPYLEEKQLDQIRLSLGHLQRISLGSMYSYALKGLLKAPVTARWRDIGPVEEAGAGTGELLLRLQTLTKLDLTYSEESADVNFLPQLPQLTALKLDCDKWGEGLFIPPDAVLASLLLCNGLTELDLWCGFNSAQWSALFAKLPHLKKLTIRGGDLHTLECLAAGPITESLEELALRDLALPPSEVSHLSGLRHLCTLHFCVCFSPLLDDATVNSLAPPTPRIPTLTELFHETRIGRFQWDRRHRQGPSFEWMQQRLTQEGPSLFAAHGREMAISLNALRFHRESAKADCNEPADSSHMHILLSPLRPTF